MQNFMFYKMVDLLFKFDRRQIQKLRLNANNKSILRVADIHISIWQFLTFFDFQAPKKN